MGEASFNLGAFDREDLQVLSAMVRDDVSSHRNQMASLPATPRSFRRRFRWEDRENAKRLGREVERVQSLLLFENVIRVASQGVDRTQTDTILSVLTLR